MLKLKAGKRDPKTKAKYLRKEGKLPAVFYGRKEKSTPVWIPANEFIRILHHAGESTVFNLAYLGKEVQVLVQDVAYHPVTGDPIHADFYAIEADRPVEVDVPVVFQGEAPIEKEQGGAVVKVLHEITVKGLPKDLPHEIVADISSLDTLESQITVSMLPVPTGIELLADPAEIVAAVSEVKEEEEIPTEAEEFDASKVEVEEKGKTEEENAEDENGQVKEQKGEKRKDQKEQ